ncbi:MAG TPA: hypothetical protein VFN26_16070 [Candidatus Acidoferrum sp.]|nr:hypothetical protein [Candidatus Acidoferrum sp.]
MLSWILFAATYIALGALLIFFSHELATSINRVSMKFYEIFPPIKKRIPLSRLAGTQTNYRISRIYFRLLGAVMLLGGAILLGKVMMYRR